MNDDLKTRWQLARNEYESLRTLTTEPRHISWTAPSVDFSDSLSISRAVTWALDKATEYRQTIGHIRHTEHFDGSQNNIIVERWLADPKNIQKAKKYDDAATAMEAFVECAMRQRTTLATRSVEIERLGFRLSLGVQEVDRILTREEIETIRRIAIAYQERKEKLAEEKDE